MYFISYADFNYDVLCTGKDLNLQKKGNYLYNNDVNEGPGNGPKVIQLLNRASSEGYLKTNQYYQKVFLF